MKLHPLKILTRGCVLVEREKYARPKAFPLSVPFKILYIAAFTDIIRRFFLVLIKNEGNQINEVLLFQAFHKSIDKLRG